MEVKIINEIDIERYRSVGCTIIVIAVCPEKIKQNKKNGIFTSSKELKDAMKEYRERNERKPVQNIRKGKAQSKARASRKVRGRSPLGKKK